MPLRSPTPTATRLSSDTSGIAVGIVLSLILHIALLAVILISKPHHQITAFSTIEVSIEPPPSAKRTQPSIVSPNSAPAEPPKESNKLSDRNSVADVEQIKRGVDGSGSGNNADSQGGGAAKALKQNQPQHRDVIQQKIPEQTKATSKSTKHSKTSLDRDRPLDLKLDQPTLALNFGTQKTPPAKGLDNNEKARQQHDITSRSLAEQILNSPSSKPSFSISNYQAFSRPAGSGAAFLGSGGTSDYLPNLPDGDITLLNAKANIYASFVRRVAIQVFNQLRAEGWESLSAREIREISDFTTVRATMSSEGKLISTEVLDRSGSSQFDAVVQTAATKGTSDPNPPAGAEASDGTIRFIFKARSWSQLAVNRRSGAPFEQRWILLATGLE